jgi:hypothetical protein
MILHDLLTDLTYGELSNLELGNFIAGEPESEPDPTRYAQLISHINLGLKQLYKEFFLRSEEHYIQLHEEISTYKLSSEYAQTNTASAIPIADRYIMDTADNPFYDNVLKIEEVYDEEGNKIPLNDITEELSVYTPTYRTIQVPYPDDESTISVQFRASHPKIVYTGAAFDPADIEIELPNSLHEALLFYVAAKQYYALGGERTIEGDNYFQRYMNSVKIVKDEGLEVQGEPGDWRFDQHGWV